MSVRAALSALVFVSAVACAGAVWAAGSGGTYDAPPANSATEEIEYKTAMQLIAKERYAEAIVELQTALANYPDSPDVLNYLGFCNRKLEQFDVALDYYTRALNIDPGHKGAHEYLGELYLQTADLPKAEAELATLVTLCPTGCSQRTQLEDAIAAYKTAHPGAA